MMGTITTTPSDDVVGDARIDALHDIYNDPAMLTTKDNPFNPFIQFDDWYGYDVNNGYHTCAYLARVVLSSPELSIIDETLANEQAINEIVEFDLLGIYQKVRRSTFNKRGTDSED